MFLIVDNMFMSLCQSTINNASKVLAKLLGNCAGLTLSDNRVFWKTVDDCFPEKEAYVCWNLEPSLH